MSHGDRKLAEDVLRILHGARELPRSEAIETLKPFLNGMNSRVPGDDRFGDASTVAVNDLVHSLETKGIATNDIWQDAIETTLSMADAAD